MADGPPDDIEQRAETLADMFVAETRNDNDDLRTRVTERDERIAKVEALTFDSVQDAIDLPGFRSIVADAPDRQEGVSSAATSPVRQGWPLAADPTARVRTSEPDRCAGDGGENDG